MNNFEILLVHYCMCVESLFGRVEPACLGTIPNIARHTEFHAMVHLKDKTHNPNKDKAMSIQNTFQLLSEGGKKKGFQAFSDFALDLRMQTIFLKWKSTSISPEVQSFFVLPGNAIKSTAHGHKLFGAV